jgi:hypothetical protein
MKGGKKCRKDETLKKMGLLKERRKEKKFNFRGY